MGRSIRPRPTGVGRFAANLLDGLADVLPSGSLTAFLTRDAPWHGAGRVRERRAPLPTPTEYARACWEQTVVPAQVATLRLDVYHSPNYLVPFALPCAAVVTIHDLTYLKSALHRLRSHVYLSILTWFAVHRAAAIVADSEATRRDVEARYPTAVGRTHVIPAAVDPALRRPERGEVCAYRERLGLGAPYVLYVGSLEPRKNLDRLVKAYERVVAEHDLPHHLILAGPRGWKVDALDAAIARSPLRDRVHQPGYVPERDLGACYAGADLFVYPSVEEGFGLPPLEAMAMGTPVVTSCTSSLPEVVGDAGLLVDPHDSDALAGAMTQVLTDRVLAERLRCAGPRRAAQFSWEASARQYVAVYEQAAGRARG